MAINVEALEKLGIHESPEAVESLVLEAMEALLANRRLADPCRELSPAEAEALSRGGLNLEREEYGAADPLLRSVAEYSALVATSLTVSQTAKMLSVDGSRVRQRLAARTLYGIRMPSGWRLPVFQFEKGQALPGLERVIPRLPTEIHPLGVARWFLTPNTDLVFGPDETPVSPRDWLRQGFDAEVVAELAGDI